MGDKKQLIYHLVSLIPSGKVMTYGQISRFLKVNSARAVGQILHQNKDPEIPCFKVVFADGSLSKNYGFGGEKKQKEFLEKDGVVFEQEEKPYIFQCDRHKKCKVALKKCLWRPTKVLGLYFQLLEKFGFPGPWPWFQSRVRGSEGERSHSKEEIVIGAVLTQNTNWYNVEKATANLRKSGGDTLFGIYTLGKINFEDLRNLIKPSGFYNQKAERLFNLAKFIIDSYCELQNFSLLSLKEAREKLLSLKGIGEETADTILLYAAEKPIFVIDNYTKRFFQRYFADLPSFYDRAKMEGYLTLQKFFMDNLPLNTKIFQDYHALIVKWGKTDKN